MSQPEHTVLGFDACTDGDDRVIVMRRSADGTWVIEDDTVPLDVAAIARQVAEQYTAHRPPAPPVAPLAEQVGQWIAATAGTGELELTPWQKDVLARLYGSEPAIAAFRTAVRRGRVHGLSEHAAQLLQELDVGKADGSGP